VISERISRRSRAFAANGSAANNVMFTARERACDGVLEGDERLETASTKRRYRRSTFTGHVAELVPRTAGGCRSDVNSAQHVSTAGLPSAPNIKRDFPSMGADGDDAHLCGRLTVGRAFARAVPHVVQVADEAEAC
jgi:hypothetical protein